MESNRKSTECMTFRAFFILLKAMFPESQWSPSAPLRFLLIGRFAYGGTLGLPP